MNQLIYKIVRDSLVICPLILGVIAFPSLSDEEKRGEGWTRENTLIVKGFVFNDNSEQGRGNGILDNGEQGLAQRWVLVSYDNTYSTVETNEQGAFSESIPLEAKNKKIKISLSPVNDEQKYRWWNISKSFNGRPMAS
ncbi:hypothetical protein L0B53_18155 [Vibrio sp. SS-MA-C1-2]|uniref:hypothetical protein n=1 Tax=Vibrio sp. SS-MA-C1-2 TaxID=2908646 RepID=UPI001F2BEC26|nr:hypothetical protein [Vibrio sp. SS-MA-C1-2]UJF18865.1 hypothetical protein L0B53_18155 [Vibrio sp. SS-MA-C1-2]